MLFVSATSPPNALAGAVAKILRSEGLVDLQGIGPAATNQLVKGLIIARRYLNSESLDLVFQPAFVQLEQEGERRIAIRCSVQVIPLDPDSLE